jgi:hypothetical protein
VLNVVSESLLAAVGYAAVNGDIVEATLIIAEIVASKVMGPVRVLRQHQHQAHPSLLQHPRQAVVLLSL